LCQKWDFPHKLVKNLFSLTVLPIKYRFSGNYEENKKESAIQKHFLPINFSASYSNVLEMVTRKDILLRIGIKLSTSFLNI